MDADIPGIGADLFCCGLSVAGSARSITARQLSRVLDVACVRRGVAPSLVGQRGCWTDERGQRCSAGVRLIWRGGLLVRSWPVPGPCCACGPGAPPACRCLAVVPSLRGQMLSLQAPAGPARVLFGPAPIWFPARTLIVGGSTSEPEPAFAAGLHARGQQSWRPGPHRLLPAAASGRRWRRWWGFRRARPSGSLAWPPSRSRGLWLGHAATTTVCCFAGCHSRVITARLSGPIMQGFGSGGQADACVLGSAARRRFVGQLSASTASLVSRKRFGSRCRR